MQYDGALGSPLDDQVKNTSSNNDCGIMRNSYCVHYCLLCFYLINILYCTIIHLVYTGGDPQAPCHCSPHFIHIHFIFYCIIYLVRIGGDPRAPCCCSPHVSRTNINIYRIIHLVHPGGDPQAPCRCSPHFIHINFISYRIIYLMRTGGDPRAPCYYSPHFSCINIIYRRIITESLDLYLHASRHKFKPQQYGALQSLQSDVRSAHTCILKDMELLRPLSCMTRVYRALRIRDVSRSNVFIPNTTYIYTSAEHNKYFNIS